VTRWLPSLRARITVVAVALALVALVVMSGALVESQRRSMTTRIDDELAGDVTDLGRSIRRLHADMTAGGGRADLRDVPVVTGDDGAVQLLDATGVVLSASARGRDLPPLADRAAAAPAIGPAHSLHANAHFRVRTATVRVGSDRVVVASAENVDFIDDSVAALRGALVLAVVVVGAVFGLLVWLAVGVALRPVGVMRGALDAIPGDDPRERVATSGATELADLASTMNELLGRVESATDAQRRFVADASHELRSPLTRLRTDLEVDLASATPDPALRQRTLEEVLGVQELVENLLTLARPAGCSTLSLVDLDDVALTATKRARSSATVPIDTSGVMAVQVSGDASSLGRLVDNLLTNAARHAASIVELVVAHDDGSALLTVTDDGPGIAADDADRIFERFTRLDASRSSSDGGSGLGLAIARRIAADHGGTLTVDRAHVGGARFVLRLPSAFAG
jgi:signal transduction histidine kinase